MSDPERWRDANVCSDSNDEVVKEDELESTSLKEGGGPIGAYGEIDDWDGIVPARARLGWAKDEAAAVVVLAAMVSKVEEYDKAV